MPVDDKTEALLQALIDVVWTAHKLRAVGGRTGAVNAAGGGTWGILHTLVCDGPKTVPQIARMRPVARQHIQTMANELAVEGLVEFIDNPAHKRSKLVAITRAGKTRYTAIKSQLLELAGEIAKDLSAEDIAVTGQVLARVMGDLDRRIDAGDP